MGDSSAPEGPHIDFGGDWVESLEEEQFLTRLNAIIQEGGRVWLTIKDKVVKLVAESMRGFPVSTYRKIQNEMAYRISKCEIWNNFWLWDFWYAVASYLVQPGQIVKKNPEILNQEKYSRMFGGGFVENPEEEKFLVGLDKIIEEGGGDWAKIKAEMVKFVAESMRGFPISTNAKLQNEMSGRIPWSPKFEEFMLIDFWCAVASYLAQTGRTIEANINGISHGAKTSIKISLKPDCDA